jgi:hypothetical protein
MERWSCPSCSKQFKGFQYVKNHLRHKHPTCVQDCIDRVFIENAIFTQYQNILGFLGL